MHQLVSFSLLIVHFCGSLQSTSASEVRTENDGMSYLLSYGYMDMTSISTKYSNNISQAMHDGVTMFQSMAGIPVSGLMDGVTLLKMNQPRCSNKERMDIHTNSQISRASSTTRGWMQAEIHYQIVNLPSSGLSYTIVRHYVKKAFSLWEQVANIVAKEVIPSVGGGDNGGDEDDVHIRISFEKGDHQDNIPFGERMNGVSVAHAFLPSHYDPRSRRRRQRHRQRHALEGSIHMDDSRGWTVNSPDGINFYQVCVHEIGHALGLEHSMVVHSVMHPFVRICHDPDFHLHPDDIQGIRNLYGARDNSGGFDDSYPIENQAFLHNDYVPNLDCISGTPFSPQVMPLMLENQNTDTTTDNPVSEIHEQHTFHRISNSLENIWFIKNFKNETVVVS